MYSRTVQGERGEVYYRLPQCLLTIRPFAMQIKNGKMLHTKGLEVRLVHGVNHKTLYITTTATHSSKDTDDEHVDKKRDRESNGGLN